MRNKRDIILELTDESDDTDSFNSLAYPNYIDYIYAPPPRNVNKWIEAVKDIYYKQRNGLNRTAAITASIGKWDEVEQGEFLRWMKFYEEGAHLKYKYAQMWYEGVKPGYFLPVKDEPQDKSDDNYVNDFDSLSGAEKKKIIEFQRKKIIGRLDSAEKILRSEEGQLFAGKEFETLLEIIYQLKKKIQLINKKSASTRIYGDMIVREANILKKNGFSDAANVLYALAETPSVPPPSSPTEIQGAPTTLMSTTVGTAPQENNSPASIPGPQKPAEEEPSEGMKEFLEGLSGGSIMEVNESNDLEVSDSDDAEIVVEAQEVPPPSTPAPAASEKVEAPKAAPAPKADPSAKPEQKADIEVTDGPSSNFDSVIDAAFQNLKVDDVVAKLEDLAKIFKTREIPRQLATVDMMLDHLGLASFFPSLAEATNKSLESNQYVLTRVEDILSKLRGTMAGGEVDLTPEDTGNPATEGLKGKLTEEENKDKARKQMRKDLENKRLEDQTKETPEVEIEEDLSQPSNVKTEPAAVPPPATPAPTPTK